MRARTYICVYTCKRAYMHADAGKVENILENLYFREIMNVLENRQHSRLIENILEKLYKGKKILENLLKLSREIKNNINKFRAFITN